MKSRFYSLDVDTIKFELNLINGWSASGPLPAARERRGFGRGVGHCLAAETRWTP